VPPIGVIAMDVKQAVYDGTSQYLGFDPKHRRAIFGEYYGWNSSKCNKEIEDLEIFTKCLSQAVFTKGKMLKNTLKIMKRVVSVKTGGS
jgi:hypothetical protein